MTGTAADGEGFFDPGPGFTGRLRVAIDGGVRVNRVTYASPTSLSLDVSTQCAANGPHALTIVNPDGQSMTAHAALTTNITPPPSRAVPDAPSLSGTASTNAVSLAWAAASGCEPTAYILEAGSVPGASNLYVGPMGTATSFATGAPQGVYYVRVRGVNDLGTGPPSNELELTVGTARPPGAPSALLGTVSGQNVSLTWQAPTSGGAVQAYVLEAGTGPGLADLAMFALPAGSTAFQTGGVPFGTYYLRVRARNDAGTGAPSNEVTLVVSGTPPGVPANLVASVAVGGRVTMTWSAPNAGGAVTTYRLEAGSAPGRADLAVVSLPATPTAFATANVPPGTYHVRVIAVNAAGAGAPSNEVVITVP